MAAYNKPQPHAYPSTNNQLVPFTAPHRQIDPPSRITNHDSYDNDSEINRELPQVDSGELEKKGIWKSDLEISKLTIDKGARPAREKLNLEDGKLLIKIASHPISYENGRRFVVGVEKLIKN